VPGSIEVDPKNWNRSRGKVFVDALAGGSHRLLLHSSDKMAKDIRGIAWVKMILRDESKSKVQGMQA